MADQGRAGALFSLALSMVLWWLLARPAVALADELSGDPIWIVAADAAAAVAALLVIGLGVQAAPLRELGLRPGAALAHLMIGLAAGMLLLALVIALLAAGGWYETSPDGMSGELLAAHLGTWLLVAVFEESLVRGIVLRLLERAAGTLVAVVLSSAVFAALHVGGEGLLELRGVLIGLGGGLLFAGAFCATRTLWAPIGLHWGWNLAQGAIFGLDARALDLEHGLVRGQLGGPGWLTGAAAGPESGVLGAGVAAVAGLALLEWARRRGRIVPFDQVATTGRRYEPRSRAGGARKGGT